MRKLTILITAIAFLVISMNICGAVERNEFALGGVRLNIPYDDVIKMYGQPTSHPGGYAQLVSDVITYNGVEIGFLGKKVRYVVTTKNNGWETPSGVRVGMSIDDVIGIFGADYSTQIRNKSDIPKWMLNSDKKYFDYTWTGTRYTWKNFVSDELTLALSVVETGGKVTAVIIHQFTPEN
ncbi:MAG: hypothetical protein IJQ16_07800 [Selenomonadaceae bacterium]|nr:hypothetical protein [Selenomonadaceae bacterium]